MGDLRGWKKALRNAIDDLWGDEFDSDHPECPHCSSTMDFYGHDDNGDFAYGEGYWECHCCGFKITEDDL